MRSEEVTPKWHCDYTGTPLSEDEALATVAAIGEGMCGSDDDLNAYDRQQALELLRAGSPVTKVIASLATGDSFQLVVWQIAVAAAYDYIAAILGLPSDEANDAIKRGFVCSYAQAHDEPGNLLHTVNLGWMLASIVQGAEYSALDPNCNRLPQPQPLPVKSSHSGRADADLVSQLAKSSGAAPPF